MSAKLIFGADRLTIETWCYNFNISWLICHFLVCKYSSYPFVPNCYFANSFEYSPAIQENRVSTVQGLSGTGSLRVGGEFLAKHYHQVKCSVLNFIFYPLSFLTDIAVRIVGLTLFDCIHLFSGLYTCHNLLGEIIPRFLPWQV